jgi:hypothetical protein
MSEKRLKNVVVPVRFTEKGYEAILTMAKNRGMGRCKYIQECALNGEPGRVSGSSRDDQTSQLLREINHIGNNLNQLTVVANRVGFLDIEKLESIQTLLVAAVGKLK